MVIRKKLPNAKQKNVRLIMIAQVKMQIEYRLFIGKLVEADIEIQEILLSFRGDP